MKLRMNYIYKLEKINKADGLLDQSILRSQIDKYTLTTNKLEFTEKKK